MEMTRTWAMPNSKTFSIKPINEFVNRYLVDSEVSIDPFARDNKLATITNDLNPNTAAEYHLDVLDFLLEMMLDSIKADIVLFDPPYSLRQMKEVYNGIGIEKLTMYDTHRCGRWGKEKNIIPEILKPDGIVLSFGWNSIGMCKKRDFEIIEVLLVCHGGAHNDTICIAEKRKSK